MSNNNYRQNELKSQQRRTWFVHVSDTSILVNDPDLRGSSLVYKDVALPVAEACQTSVLIKESKRSTAYRVFSRRHRTDGLLPAFYVFGALKDFPLVECGSTSMERSVLACDVDQSMTVQEVWHKLKEVQGLPNCVLTQNSLTGHWQVQFYLRSSVPVKQLHFEKREDGKWGLPSVVENSSGKLKWSALVLKLATKMLQTFPETDLKYVGTMCRNPHFQEQKSCVVVNGRIRALEGLPAPTVSLEEVEEFLKDVRIRRNACLSKPEPKEKTFCRSRHQLTLQYGREWMFWYMRTRGRRPEVQELSEYLHSSAPEIAEACGKDPHSWNEIEGQVSSIYNWCVEHYKERDANGRQWKCSEEWNKNQRAAKVKKAASLKKTFLSLRAAGYSMKDVADVFSMSRPTLYTYLLLFMVVDTVATAVRRNGMYSGKCWSVVILEINDAVSEMKKSKIRWKELELYTRSVEDSEHFVDYEGLELDGNKCQLEVRIAA